MTSGRRTAFLGLRFDHATLDEAVNRLRALPGDRFRYVVTPNVDHVVRLHASDDTVMWAAYGKADFCFCDSRVLQLLAKRRGVDLAVVTGSDLVSQLIPAAVRPGDHVTLVGGDTDVSARLAALIPHARVTAHYPALGMLANAAAMDAAVAFVADTPARFHLLACGSPQQELLAFRAAATGRATGTALCIGAGVEFLVGRKARAPRIFRAISAEWLFRLLCEPRRMWRRYLVKGPKIFMIARNLDRKHRN